MKNLGKPVDNKYENLTADIKAQMNIPNVDFTDTKTAFAIKSNEELRKATWLFGLMNRPWLVGIGSTLGLTAIKLHLPFVESVVKNTIFAQFCGGTSLEKSAPTIEKLYDYKVQTILDYGAEAKESDEEFDQTMQETIRAIEYATTHESVPIVSTKITGMARFELLEMITEGKSLDDEQLEEYNNVLQRLDKLCKAAHENGVGVFFDAEESWIQGAIDQYVNIFMERYNKEKAIIFNTFQMYRRDRLEYLKKSFAEAQQKGYILGAKLVRGAYMDKERARAEEMGYPSPIQPNKEATDRDYNAALEFCIKNYKSIASCNASHNEYSAKLQARLVGEMDIPNDHPHLNFCQLYGMSDHITFNLAKAGYNVAKYLPYGTVRDVVPYLIRRAQENTSLTGDMTREYALVSKELKRRQA